MRSISYALLSTLAALCVLINVGTSYAQALPDQTDVPHTISFQGLLSEKDGSPVQDGTHSITLTLYSDPSGTNEIWKDTYSTTINNGIFNLYIGGGNTPLPETDILNGPLWVGVQLGDGPPMLPLTPLSASPYALNVANGSVTTEKLADGAVTSEKIGVDYVSGIAVNGTPVTGKGTLLNIEGGNDIALQYDEVSNTIRLGKPSPATSGDASKEAQTLAVADAVWSLNGDGWDVSAAAAVVPGAGDWIGTSATSGATFEMRTNGQTAMRYQPNGTNTPNIIGGNSSNSVTAASIGSAIGGGMSHYINGDYSVIGGGDSNVVLNFYAFIGGGQYQSASGTYATLGGGKLNSAEGDYSFGGGGYENVAYGNYSVVGGGLQNIATGAYSSVTGGVSNETRAGFGHIGGGYDNTTESQYSFIGSGEANIISTTASTHSGITAGKDNTISSTYGVIGAGESNTVSGSHAAVVAGYSNTAQGLRSYVGGGYVNQAIGVNAAIAGGSSNIASGTNSTIGGGYSNYAEGTESFIGSGTSNIVITGKEHSALAGGWYNSIESSFGFLGGGSLNTASGDYAVVGGGSENTASGLYAMIGSGHSITASGDYSVAGGGQSNTASGESAVVGGGYSNTASGAQSFIGSGYVNQAIGINSSIGGGNSNSATGTASAIAGGYSNYAQGSNAFIGAGTSNNVATTASDAGVGSGWYNTANASYSFVGGGYLNTTGGLYSAIPGGDNLITTGYAQSAVGFYNDSRGTLTSQPDDVTIVTNNDPLFMVGNGVYPAQGGATIRSNAFEVSYNGHSVVSDNIRTSVAVAPGNRTPVLGARYIDNTMYGWGDIGIFGGINSSFGVDNVQHPAAGVYIVTLRLEDKNGTIINLNEAAITATLVTEAEGNPFQCADIKVSRIGVPGPNMFTVWTIGPNCTALNSAFMFHVTGRP